MAYKQNPGRVPMMKTGRDIPLNMKSPAYMKGGPGDEKEETNKTSSSSQKTEAHVSGYKPLDKKHYFSDKKDLASQVFNVANKQAYKRDSVIHKEDDLRLNKLKPGSRVPGTKYIVNNYNSKTNSFEARKEGTLSKVSISRRRMVNKIKPKVGRYYELKPKKIEKFDNFNDWRNNN